MEQERIKHEKSLDLAKLKFEREMAKLNAKYCRRLKMQEQEKVFINGKSQAISMLKLLTKSERMRIISAIRIKNPSLADELNNQSISFKDIELLNDESLMNVSRKVRPEILVLP